MTLEINNFYPVKDADQFKALATLASSLAEPNRDPRRFTVNTKPIDGADSGVWTVVLEFDKRGIFVELDGKPYFNVLPGERRSAEDILRVILTLKDAFNPVRAEDARTPETELKVVAASCSHRHVVSILEDGTIIIKGNALRQITLNNADGFVNFLSDQVDQALDGLDDENVSFKE